MMILKLTNFRSFTSETFQFTGDFILVSGMSGTGKTTIFMAMNFAVTGDGKKVTQFGKKSCQVEFTIPTDTGVLIITRSKGPCRLLVKTDEKVYEDKEAQGIIDKEFPQWELGYVAQRLCRSFVSMTPAEKLTYIEKIAFGSENLEKIQKKCKLLISDRKETLLVTSREKTTLVKLLQDFDAKDTNVNFDESVLAGDICCAKRNLTALRQRYDNAVRIKNAKETVNEKLINLPALDDSLDGICLASLSAQDARYVEYLSKKSLLDKLSSGGDVPSNIASDELQLMISEMKTIIDLERKMVPLASLQSELNALKTFKQTHAVKLTCPVCHSGVGLWKNTLRKDDGLTSIDHSRAEECDQKCARIEIRVEQLERDAEKLAKIYLDYPELTSAQNQLNALEETLEKDREYFSLMTKCEKLKCDKPTVDVKTIAKRIQERQKIKTTRELLTSELASLNKTIDDPDEIKLRVEEMASNLTILESNLKSAEFSKYWQRVNTLNSQEKEVETTLPRAVKLQSLIKTAEKIALDETIEQINCRAQIYLDKFLPDVNVSLVFNGRLDIDVIYKQHASDLGSLSGGEFARVVLAFTIAMAEMNNVYLLLLDESLSSLDADTTSEVINVVKANYSGQVISIAHQTTKGVFDQVVEL
jgi:energy-coupling factor transporter ATP-binding protein EcfA2